MKIKIIVAALLVLAISCSPKKPAPAPQLPAREQPHHKVAALTKNLRTSVNKLNCSNKKNWSEAKERATRLIWNSSSNETHLEKSKEFLATLKQAEASENSANCESFLKSTRNNIRVFENSLRKKKGNS